MRGKNFQGDANMHAFFSTGSLPDLLSALGLNPHEGKLKLSSVLEINRNTVSDQPPQNLTDLPWTFLRKLMMANLNARNVKSAQDHLNDDDNADADNYSNAINPLDLITALFHCSDPFLQQEMVSKMAMCQFAVPLLLPNCDTQKSTLMLWAMRDLVKKYRPHCQAGEKTFLEGRVVEMAIPMVSFVRLGESSLPKSQILNKLLSNPHQHNDTFVHYDMECGDVPRKISDGLVELSWYLPSGNSNIDVFTEPVAMANLRGDGRLFQTQMSFLFQNSAAVFIFCDDQEGALSSLFNKGSKSSLSDSIFLVTKFKSKTLKDTCKTYNINEKNVIIKQKQNDSDFVKALRVCVKGVIENNPIKLVLKEMAAPQEGILVDEDCEECTNGKENAIHISENIIDVVKFKEDQLPLHGNIWKEISQLEKEICRMRKAGNDLEQYRSTTQDRQEELRKEQRDKAESKSMEEFTTAISASEIQRLYFLKWLKIQLDTLSRGYLSSLRQQYKECCRNTPQNKELISRLDEQISDCSLGPEHFFRELGQLYEAACSLPENDPARQKVQNLPFLCAQMLLDGFPVELVDGDASNIPMKWISEVLTQLHKLVGSRSRMLVLTVLGVQSTGKSTLLNTMFGVQFAVSSGRCTRGAFMLLIKVSEDLRSELQCDFLMVIDTEGLKSPELAALDTSYEHDNELATLVIGLSDITIINIAMENNTEMKDILQIVVHAFLRMKEIGKKPRCMFVHQNVSDMSAHDANMRDRKKMMEQLDEMTRAAANMEKKVGYEKFTDVMEYDPEKDSYYIPGLWHGTPPMAPVNAGYSEAVYELKKSLIYSLQRSADTARNDAMAFLKWTEGLWESVKYEKFIFSFRNSLVADAYTKLCSEYNKWEWAFQREMNSWLLKKETIISNSSGSDGHVASLKDGLKEMIREASEKLDEEEKGMHKNIEEYFKKKDNSIALVEKYKEDFKNSASSLRQEIEGALKVSLHKAIEIKEGLELVDTIKSTQAEKIEEMVQGLVQSCRKKKKQLSDEDLNREFEDMWEKLVADLSSVKLQKEEVVKEALVELKRQFERKPEEVNKNLNETYFRTAGQAKFEVQSGWITKRQMVFTTLTHFDMKYAHKKTQEICFSIIKHCETFVSDKVKSKARYQSANIKEVLNKIDEKLKEQKEITVSETCECELKFHICWKAAVKFQEMHDGFIRDNDPKSRLEQSKEKFLEEFKDLFHDRDQCLKKADEFTKECLKPAIEDYIPKRLGPDIAEEMLSGDRGLDYSTRTHFQFALLQNLLEEEEFEKFKQYTHNYEEFVNSTILDKVIETYSQNDMWQNINLKHLSEVVKKITKAINLVKKETEEKTDMKTFIQKIRAHLNDELTFQEDASFFMTGKSANTQQFASNLIDALKEMQQSLTEEYKSSITQDKLKEAIRQLPFRPHDLLFNRLCGCGHQCPFCGTPCEAGGKEHKIHHSSMHRPQGLGHYTWNNSDKLITEICTTAVISKTSFKTSETKGKWHPFMDYKEIYPYWDIVGDSSMEASDYWKYVFMKYNNEFADDEAAFPADIPEAWKKLTPKHAKVGLRKAFNMSDHKVK